jgi:hypothetical protein
MKKKTLYILAVIVMLQFVVLVRPVEAVSVLSVTPSSVSNAAQTNLTVTGTDFVDGSVVQLNGSIALATTFIDASTLTAVLPQGFQAGVYNVAVVNPDLSSAVLPNGLTVLNGISTQTPIPTVTATTIVDSTPTPAFARPVVVVSDYGIDPELAQLGGEFTLTLTVTNRGQVAANNLVITFTPGDFSPLKTGGVLVIGELGAGGSRQIKQSFVTSASLWGQSLALLETKIGYTDANNTAYNEVFNVSVPIAAPNIPGATATPTPTATVQVSRPRLLVISSQADIDVLQPGSKFSLLLQIQNVGTEAARNVNMVVGGASLTDFAGTDTPGSGSFSATSGDFQNFSPLGSSNIQALGDIPVDAVYTAAQSLIVNVSTNPGAYPLKISYVYQNAKGETLVDDQVITLLVQSIPLIDISFYSEPGEFYTFQPAPLPIQVVNIGRKSVILGTLKVSVSNGMLENSSLQIGYLDPGGYLTLDALFTPDTAGPVTVQLSLDYIDDFNQPQLITSELEVQVIEMPPMEFPSEMDPGVPVVEPMVETFWQKVWRFIKGLLGLDSSPTQAGSVEFQVEGKPVEAPVEVPVPVKGP